MLTIKLANKPWDGNERLDLREKRKLNMPKLPYLFTKARPILRIMQQAQLQLSKNIKVIHSYDLFL